MEIWDVYKIDGSFAGYDLIRGELIPKGLYHLVSEILVKHVDGSYLLMQRDFNKESYPGMFEATAGGSALKGESPITAALRELREETGIHAGDLVQINKTNSDNTIFYSFLCMTDCNKSAIILQTGETVSYRWITKEEFLEFMNSSECIPPQRDRLKPYIKSVE
jgi:8-oxo-dGTP pyrophosphatase MutT (NUDIX family)